MPRLLSLMFIVAAVISCRAPARFSKKEQQIVIDSVTRTLHTYYDEISKNGLLVEFNYLDSSDNFFWVPPGYSQAISFDSAAIVIRKNAPFIRTIGISWENLRVIPLTEELATYTGKLHSISTDIAGHASDVFLVETGLVVKRKNGWKLLSGQTSVVN